MPKYKYGYKIDEKCAPAQAYNIDASFKDLAAVCDNIRGMDVNSALDFLERARRMEIPIYYRKWNKKLGHRRELGGKKGRYPRKAVGIVMEVLKNAIANAEQKGLTNLYIVHASANKQSIYPRLQPKGRRIRSDYETARVEIVLREKEGEREEKNG
ncbi:MAG: 50S ribosomal protein L22 [Candidatus Micrarchaeia archaeon]